MMLFGNLERSDSEVNHPGERPLAENLSLILDAGSKIDSINGITLTVPYLYRRIICRCQAWFRLLHDTLELLVEPSLALVNSLFCRKT